MNGITNDATNDVTNGITNDATKERFLHRARETQALRYLTISLYTAGIPTGKGRQLLLITGLGGRHAG